MAGLFGGGGSKGTPVVRYTSVNLQTSAQGLAIPIGWGKFRASTNILWYNNFRSYAKKQKSGKGGGGGSTVSYTYSCALIMGLCEGGEGGIQGIGAVYAGRATTSMAALGLTLFTGSQSQTPWSYVTSAYPGQDYSYAGTAYVANSNYQLGNSPDLPSHNFEVIGALSGTMPYLSGVDANMADIIDDYLTNPYYSLVIPDASIDAASLAYLKTYCQAVGFFFSPYLDSQEQAISTLQRWAQITNSWIFWSGTQIKFVPLGDAEVTANDVTYIPNNTPVYDLTYDDFQWDNSAEGGPVTVIRSDPADGYNQIDIDIRDRNNQYNNTPLRWNDQPSIDTYGALQPQVVQAHEICDQTVGYAVLSAIGKRSVYIRNDYQFKLAYNYILLEPGDLVTITDPNIGLNRFPVRIKEVGEDESGFLSIIAEEYPAAVGVTAAFPGQDSTVEPPINTQVLPGDVNPPGIIEPNALATGSVPQVWISASGGANWGGCDVYISFDGDAYSMIGTIDTSADQGVLTAALPSGSDPDTVNTLSVDLTVSAGVLPATATHADADALRTLVLVDGELMAYGEAALGAGPYDFDLNYLRRGAYGTAIASHASGAEFSRMDPASMLQYALPQEYVGETIYLKFVSFNTFALQYQDISDVVEYTYTPTGSGYYIAPPTAAALSVNRVTQADGTTLLEMDLSWVASDGPILGGYEIQTSTDSGTTWAAGINIGATVVGYTLTPATANTNYRMRIRAISTTGINISTWDTTTTVNSGSLVLAVPSAPTGLTTVAQPAAAQLYWDASADPTVFNAQVWRADLAGAFGTAVNIADVGRATTFFDTTTDPGTQYTYYIVFVNAKGSSLPSTGSTVTTLAAGSGQPYDIAMSYIGLMPGPVGGSNYRFYRAILARAVTFPSNFAGGYIRFRVAPAVDYVTTIYKNGVSVGTGTVLSGNTTGTFATSGAVVFAAGDVLEIDGDTFADVSAMDLSITLVGTR